jgi:hypothetical protein
MSAPGAVRPLRLSALAAALLGPGIPDAGVFAARNRTVGAHGAYNDRQKRWSVRPQSPEGSRGAPNTATAQLSSLSRRDRSHRRIQTGCGSAIVCRKRHR